MADVTGPISTLPGSLHNVPSGMICDTEGHEDRLATKRVQGETDSMGCEMIDMCDSCYESYLVIQKEQDNEVGECEWCKKMSNSLRPTRDIDEGMSGPIYEVCQTCRKKQNDAAIEELEAYDREYPNLADDYEHYPHDYNDDDPCDGAGCDCCNHACPMSPSVINGTTK